MGEDGAQFGEEPDLDRGVPQDVEETYHAGDASGVVAGGDHGEDFIAEAVTGGRDEVFGREGGEEAFHDRGEGRLVPGFEGGYEVVDALAGELFECPLVRIVAAWNDFGPCCVRTVSRSCPCSTVFESFAANHNGKL